MVSDTRGVCRNLTSGNGLQCNIVSQKSTDQNRESNPRSLAERTSALPTERFKSHTILLCNSGFWF